MMQKVFKKFIVCRFDIFHQPRTDKTDNWLFWIEFLWLLLATHDLSSRRIENFHIAARTCFPAIESFLYFGIRCCKIENAMQEICAEPC